VANPFPFKLHDFPHPTPGTKTAAGPRFWFPTRRRPSIRPPAHHTFFPIFEPFLAEVIWEDSRNLPIPPEQLPPWDKNIFNLHSPRFCNGRGFVTPRGSLGLFDGPDPLTPLRFAKALASLGIRGLCF